MADWKDVEREIYIQKHSGHSYQPWKITDKKMTYREFLEKYKNKIIHDVDTLCETFDFIAEIDAKTDYWLKIPIREVRGGY